MIIQKHFFSACIFEEFEKKQFRTKCKDKIEHGCRKTRARSIRGQAKLGQEVLDKSFP